MTFAACCVCGPSGSFGCTCRTAVRTRSGTPNWPTCCKTPCASPTRSQGRPGRLGSVRCFSRCCTSAGLKCCRLPLPPEQPRMASYKGHLVFASVLGAGYGAAAAEYWKPDWGPVALGAGLTAVGGLLPDLDSDSGVPVRELFSLAAAGAPLLLY